MSFDIQNSNENNTLSHTFDLLHRILGNMERRGKQECDWMRETQAKREEAGRNGLGRNQCRFNQILL